MSSPLRGSPWPVLFMCPVPEKGHQDCSSSGVSSLRSVTWTAPLHVSCPWGGLLGVLPCMCPLLEKGHSSSCFLSIRWVTRATSLLASSPWRGPLRPVLFMCSVPEMVNVTLHPCLAAKTYMSFWLLLCSLAFLQVPPPFFLFVLVMFFFFRHVSQNLLGFFSIYFRILKASRPTMKIKCKND